MMGDINDSMAGLTPTQTAHAHSLVARSLLHELEKQSGGKFTGDQVLAAAQVHATLAVAAAMAARSSDG
jgi:hypothetical protein